MFVSCALDCSFNSSVDGNRGAYAFRSLRVVLHKVGFVDNSASTGRRPCFDGYIGQWYGSCDGGAIHRECMR
ncbi:hypothetical protein PanWU01x14_046700 [Parasponia andersonii]|uniref:Uncharacterized protein n=1 Tax=Parasponia andersonii TaxID=3476 RepID=A0A2P5DNT9_PARAD|nr:hypothetical protein PanWU01x14_046700 [Parasponia andersonii]